MCVGGGGSIGENDNKREGGLDVKFNTYGGALLFHSFLQTGKVVKELLEFKCKYEHWNKTDKYINSKVFGPMKLLFSYLSCCRKGMPLLYVKTVLLYLH